MSNVLAPRHARLRAARLALASLTLALAGALGASTSALAAPTSAPDCANVNLQLAFNTSGTATFTCTGTNLTYAVTDEAIHGHTGEPSGNTVGYAPDGGFSGTDAFEVTATDTDDRATTFTVNVTVDGPQNLTPDPNDQLTGQDADGFWDLDAGETDTFTLSCAAGRYAVDGSALVQTVDQGTGLQADVQVLEAWRIDPRTYEFRLHNPATGRAQGHLAVACVSEATFQGHALQITRGAQGTIEFGGGSSEEPPGDATLRGRSVSDFVGEPEPEYEPEPEGPTGPELKSILLTCGNGQTPVAPSYEVTSGVATPVQSEATPDGTGWLFTFAAFGPATVETQIWCLSYADRGLNVLLRSFRISSVASAPGNDTTKRDTPIDCPVGFIGLVGGYSTSPDLSVLGQETQAKRRLFWVQNLAYGTRSATISLLCVGLTTDTTTSLITPPGPGVLPGGSPVEYATPKPRPTTRPTPPGIVKSRRLKARRGYVWVSVACPSANPCTGRLRIFDIVPTPGAPVYLGGASYSGSARTTTRVRVRLSRAGRDLLRATGGGPLTASVVLDDGSTVTVTIRA